MTCEHRHGTCVTHGTCTCLHCLWHRMRGQCLMDCHAYPPEKNGGAWEVTMVSQSALLAAPGQSIRLPVAAIVTNQSPPVGDAPSLMTME